MISSNNLKECQSSVPAVSSLIADCRHDMFQSHLSHLFSLHHLFVEVVGEHALWVELPGALSAHENAVFAHQTSSADGHQRDPVTACALIKIEVSTLHLGAHRDSPAGRVAVHTIPSQRFCDVGLWEKQRLCSYLPSCIWVPDHDVSIGPRDDSALAWVKIVDFCSIWARHSHKTVFIHFSCDLKTFIDNKKWVKVVFDHL